MKMLKKGIVWMLLVLMVINFWGCGIKGSGTRESGSVKGKVIEW